MEFNKRKATIKELMLLKALIKKSTLKNIDNWDIHLLVEPMSDGNMGSLFLYPDNLKKRERNFGKQVSEMTFKDKDGVVVIASLNIDSDGNLYELDIWKTDFSSLIEIPDDIL